MKLLLDRVGRQVGVLDAALSVMLDYGRHDVLPFRAPRSTGS
jgi:hypothetical protein